MRTLLPVLFLAFFAACNDAENNNAASVGPAAEISSGEPVSSAETLKPFTTISACILSEISYCNSPQQQVDKYLPGWKIVWHPAAVNGNHAFIATDGHSYAVAIRGSLMEFSWDAFDNWIYQDLNIAIQKDWPYANNTSAKISQGSYRGWDNLAKMIDTSSHKTLFDFLSTQTSASTPIIFTGHSLGGNLATVYASYYAALLKQDGKTAKHINVISFAAPAAGNKAFAKDFDLLFPQSVRVENSSDIVAKFPCAEKVTSLGKLYTSQPDASTIMVGYKNMTVPLSSVFQTLSAAMTLLEFKNGISHFEQTNGNGTIITVKPSGKNNTNNVQAWFSEAGYQHGMAQYAAALGAPVISCD